MNIITISIFFLISCLFCKAQQSKIPIAKQDPNKVDASEFKNNDGSAIKLVSTRNPFGNNNQPLLVVNGEIYKDSFDVRINKLDAKNIETVKVLKDTAATNKYGSIAKYGVVEVVYKKPVKIQSSDKKPEIMQ
jgi:hypothetical protein